MKIILENISKKYNKKYVIKNFSYEFKNKYYSITGSNGSGKTTLLNIILGYISPNSGSVTYYENNSKIKDDSFGFFSFAAPYQEIIEEFTLNEIIHFHFKFLNPINKMRENEVINSLELEDYCKQFAQEYYLADSNWQYFSLINNDLPDQIGDDVTFLRNNRSLYLEDKDFRYYIYIKDYKIKGNISPLGLEKEKIRNVLLNKNKINYLSKLEDELYQNGLALDKIKMYK